MTTTDTVAEHHQQWITQLEGEVRRWERRAKVRMNLAGLPTWLRDTMRPGSWRVHHDTFAQFVTRDPPRGLGASVPLIRRMVADDPVALDLLDRAIQRAVGTNQYSYQLVSKIETARLPEPDNNVNRLGRPVGNSDANALRRLRSQRPDLHRQVLARALSPHRAMLLAGFRHPTLTVPIDDMERLADTLSRHLTEPQRRTLARLLTAGSPKATKKRAPIR